VGEDHLQWLVGRVAVLAVRFGHVLAVTIVTGHAFRHVPVAPVAVGTDKAAVVTGGGGHVQPRLLMAGQAGGLGFLGELDL